MNILNNEQELKNLMNFFLSSINSNIEILNKHRQILLQYTLKVTDYPTDDTTKETVDNIVKFLSNLTENLTLTDESISSLKNFQQKYNCIEITDNIIDEYVNISTKIAENLIKIENFLNDALNFAKLNFHITTDSIETTKNLNAIEKSVVYEDKNITTSQNSNNKNGSQNNQLVENTLVISETKKIVILPYTIDELKATLTNNLDNYSSLEDVVNKKYTVPLENYKNTSLARFKEAFNLILHREKGSFRQALELGLELFFNSNLHPAVISACKNLDELDIYLDYLEDGETNLFACFNVIFDVAPIVVKSKRSQVF